jgi:hypothetical protein
MFFYPVSNITEYSQIDNQSLETDYYEIFLSGINDPSPGSQPKTSRGVGIPMLVLTLMTVAISGFAISRYKVRPNQLKLVKSSIFINIILVAGIFLNYPKIFTHTNVSIDLALGAYFPLVSLVLLVVAHRYIMKDEKLVRSSDRLR